MARLHLACGKLHLQGFTNIDIDSEVADMKADIKHLPEFKDGSIDEIYISHCLEHFDRSEILIALIEYKRLLKTGGTLRIAVPDLENVAKLLCTDEGSHLVTGLLYGGQKNKYDFHKTGYTFSTLSNILECMGFEDIKRYDAWEFLGELNDDYSKSYIPHMDRSGILMSLNITCTNSEKLVNLNEKAQWFFGIKKSYLPAVGFEPTRAQAQRILSPPP